MKVFSDSPSLRDLTARWRGQKQRIAFVPTMGNLHDGHLSLVEIAAQNADRVVVSIYVNPLQFAPGEDFDTYPRTLQNDLDRLQGMAVDAAFTPDDSLMYPRGKQNCTYAEVPGLSDILEGEFRPGFFRGVATVVLKLFNMVQPDIAVFGEKDFQQLLIIRRMVEDLDLPIDIIAGATRREADGLAMSSRNQYLGPRQREKSRYLSECLSACRRQLENGEPIEQVERSGVKMLEDQGFRVNYLTLRRAESLEKATKNDIATGEELIILVAAIMGGTRLIDNLRFFPEKT